MAAGTFRRVAGQKVVTTLEPATEYYVAEKYHQQASPCTRKLAFITTKPLRMCPLACSSSIAMLIITISVCQPVAVDPQCFKQHFV